MKIATIPGESTDEKHKDWIELLSVEWGVRQARTGTGSSGGAQNTGRADFENLKIVHAMDAASPKFFQACATGEHIADATIDFCRAVGDKQLFMQVKLYDLVIASVKMRADQRSTEVENLPEEEVEINFSKKEIVYTKTDNKTGKPVGDVKGSWDRSLNKA
jgi:type VI secretion system secreted protein Hcp